MILKNLFRRKMRTLLTVLGISLGVAAIISLGALAKGTEAGYSSMLSGSKADLVLSQSDTLDVSLSSLDESIGAELQAFPEVSQVSAMVEGYVQTDGAPYFFIFGYPEDSFVLERFRVIDGASLADKEARRARGKPVLIGSAAAEALDKKVGDTIRLGTGAYRVVGIYETGDAFEDGGAVFLQTHAQELLGKQHTVSLYYLMLKDGARAERLKERVERKWDDLDLTSTAELNDKQMMGSSLNVFVWVIAGLAIVLGGVGMMNAQLMAVFERTREIGVLRAIGWSKNRVLVMILGESILVCLLGGLVGIAIGWLAVTFVANQTVMMGMDTRNIGPDLLLQALVTVVVLGLVGGLYPAWRASKMQPVEALRYEGGSSGEMVHRLPVGGMAVQGLWQRTTRTLLTLAVIGLTVGAILVLEATVRGSINSFTGMAIGGGAEIMLRQSDVADTSLSAIDKRYGEKIAAMPEVKGISGMIFSGLAMPDAGGFFILIGYAPNELAIHNLNVVEGKVLTGNHQIMLGKRMAGALHKDVGDTVELSGYRYKVVGIYTSSVGWEELGGVISLRDAQTFAGRPRKVTMYSVKLHDPNHAEAVAAKINREMPEVTASLRSDFANQMPDMQAVTAMMGGISLLAIVVGGIGVMNTMLMSVLERTREIGVLRAVGWRRASILALIMQESLLLALLGGATGVLIGLGLGEAIKAMPWVGESVQPAWAVDIFVRAIIIALLLGLFGGFYPAFRATRLQPIEALRYE